jgi:hypothetical protein
MKIIFLDFDGVLNSEAFCRANGNRFLPETLDVAAVARVNTLIARTGAKVVVSSTWRLGYSLDQLRGILARHGFSGEVLGVTPVIQDLDEDGIFVTRKAPRGLEIQRWIDDQPEPPEAFVILDDDADMEHLAGRLVRTLFDTGLGDEHVEAAVELLGPRVAT